MKQSNDAGKGDDNRTSDWRAYRDSPLWDKKPSPSICDNPSVMDEHRSYREQAAALPIKEEAPTHDEHDNH